jgi:hypothetical protein
MPRRSLRVQMLAADGVTALDANTHGGRGKASVNGFVAPSTGRFYVVVASEQGDATQLVGSIKVTPTKKGSGRNPDRNFVAGKQYRVQFGALEGAKLTFTAKPSAGSGLSLKPIYLIDPAGERTIPSVMIDFACSSTFCMNTCGRRMVHSTSDCSSACSTTQCQRPITDFEWSDAPSADTFTTCRTPVRAAVAIA